MNKSDLIERVAVKSKLSQIKAEQLVNVLFDSLTSAMRAGERVEIRGFGSFKIKDYSSYTGHNPKTGELVKVKPKKLPFFKVGKDLKERLST